MGSFGPIHWIIVAIVVLLLFGGRGKLSGIMGDAAKGIKAFKEGLKDDDTSSEVADNKAKGALPRTEQEAEELRKS
ncbi:twin-arginine translocase TatA/TatE family subunit [Caulobacter sp.]|jgi:sec-independent protein translocase protein TatA|uniref:twin-arginine translocase TatA/TatE family subunit n=1 Tax=Caulobacter sp. TaxID=78 RepID=UPI001B2E4ED5|nr:twin-arginine translocase TatA/TatE family subunit [Caulobacter sp.]MBO9543081.1 twin-arginine translocase TatA/TatE family subunit [Caulobacter sp.]